MNTDQKREFSRIGQLCSKFTLLVMTMILVVSCGDDDDGDNGDPNPTNGNVRLFEVDAANDEVTLRNFGDGDVDISGYWFCLQRGYQAFNSVTNDGADLVLAPDETIVFSITVADVASDVAIYDRGGSFGSADALVDFMQFGASFAGSAGREDVAVSKGIWTEGDFVEGVNVFDYTGDGSTTGVDTWEGEEEVDNGESTVRILAVDPINDRVTLKNFGSSEEDISAYFFCTRRNYVGLGTLTPVSGDLSLAEDEEVVFDLSINDASSDVALYNRGGAFADATAIIDFMQYGEDVGNAGRVSVAVEAGIWTSGEVVEGIAPFVYLGDDDDRGEDFWIDDANIRMVTIDTDLDEVVIKNFDVSERDITGYFFCTAAGVYPSFANTADIEIVSGDLVLSPNEEVRVRILTQGGVADVTGSIFLFSTNTLGFNNNNPNVLRDFAQWGAANGFRVENAVAANRWDDAANFIANSSPYTYTGDGDAIGAASWEGSLLIANVRIISVDPINNSVRIKNFGTGTRDVSGYFFCIRRVYTVLSESGLAPSGDLILDAGEELEFSITIEDGSSDVALYNRGGAFANADAIVDFMQFGDDVDGLGREEVAVTANLWTEDDFVNGVGPYTYTGDGSANGADQWSADQAGMANIRLLTVDASNDQITLKNFGNASMDISGYFFCARRSYRQLSAVAVTSGNFILAPDEEIEFNLEINNTSSDVALYNTGGAFANADTIVDFMMYGEDLPNGSTREDVANTANLWTPGDFVANPGPFNYTGDGSQQGVTSWD